MSGRLSNVYLEVIKGLIKVHSKQVQRALTAGVLENSLNP